MNQIVEKEENNEINYLWPQNATANTSPRLRTNPRVFYKTRTKITFIE